MDKSCSIVLPNQLFKESLFHKKNFKVFLIEEHLFFNQYKFHKQKISFHRATMKFYYDYLNTFGCNTEYVESFSKESNIKLLISEEIFLSYTDGGFSQNRLIMKALYTPSKKFNIATGLMHWKFQETTRWSILLSLKHALSL